MGLRERKKAATRQALYEAAVRLATEQGVENVTVEAIADAANVSRRTFSNYFSGKEEALLHADRVWMGRLLDLVRGRPAEESPWTSVGRAVAQLIAERDDHDPRRLAARRLLRNHPSLIAHQTAVYAGVERDLAAEVATRMPAGPDVPLRSRVLAATLLTTVRVTSLYWLEHPDDGLPDLVRRSLAYVADLGRE